jgi:hypothetical protein
VQQDLGHSIVNLINSLYTTAAKVRPTILIMRLPCGCHGHMCFTAGLESTIIHDGGNTDGCYLATNDSGK